MNSQTFRSLAALGCSVALATSFAGCGSDKKDDSSSTLTAAAWKKAANAICKAADGAENTTFTAMQEAINNNDKATADTQARAGAKVIRGETDAIEALQAPKELQADVTAMVKSLNDGLDKIDAEGASAANVLGDASDKAKKLGLTDCGA